MYWRVSLCLTSSHVTVLKLSKIMGCFFCKFRVTIGSGACKIAQTEEVQQVVGRCVEEDVPIQCVKKNPTKRKWQSSPEFYWRTHHIYFSYLQYRSGKKPDSLCDVQIYTGNAIKTKRGELAKKNIYIVLFREIKSWFYLICNSLKKLV